MRSIHLAIVSFLLLGLTGGCLQTPGGNAQNSPSSPGGTTAVPSSTPTPSATAQPTLPPVATPSSPIATPTVPPPSFGTVIVNATREGDSWSGPVSYTITMANQATISGNSVPQTFQLTPGTCYLRYNSGGPVTYDLRTITPSASQNMAAGSNIIFTMEFSHFGIPTPPPTGLP